jgi:phosphate transport system protein
MGDLAVEIVERSFSLIRQPAFPELIDFTEIANLVEAMVLRCLEAFAKRDAQIARAVVTSDDGVDACRKKIKEQLVAVMERDPATIPRALDYLIIVRSLERIADHATNVAEDVV